MKKLFTLALALVAFAGVANAATVDDIAVLKHSYVLVMDEITGTSASGAGAKLGKGTLFGADHFLDLTGGTTANNKGTVDLSVVDGNDGYVTQEIVDKYGADYAGPHYNCFRLKNQQDMIALKLTAKSKLIIFCQGNNKTGTAARIPRISTDQAQSNSLNAAPGEDHPATVSGFRWEYTVEDDGTYYLGSYNGDMFVSFIIVEAKEAPGTPTVKLGDQTFEGGLWFKEVTCKANPMVEEGSTESIPTVVTYTTDGSTPTVSSPKYTEPIKCYQNMTVKFQAYMDLVGNGNMSDIMEEDICDGADNEANVSFSFDAPAIQADGASVTITSPYAGQGATNYYSLNGAEAVAGDAVTLTESATVTAFTQIANGSYGTFTSKNTSKDVYVLTPIKAAKTIAVSGNAVVDEEATAADQNGNTIYKIENGAITADKADFFVKNLTFKALANEDPNAAKYQVPEGQEAYIMMSNTNITFQVAAGDSVNVKVVCSQNACKNIDSENADDRRCYVNVSGTNYGGADLLENPDGNVIEFGLIGGSYKTETDEEGNTTQIFEPADKIFTFQKYSGTGNILISSIEFTPVAGSDPGTLADGTYYLQNVATGQFLSAGSSWGTRSILTSDGLDIAVTAADGKYTLDTQVFNSDVQHFLGSNLYVDSNAFGWAIESAGNGAFTISDGSQFLASGGDNNETVLVAEAGEAAQWKFITYADRIKALAAATEAAPVNATFAIKDANFNRNDARKSAWTVVEGNPGFSGGNNTNNNAESYMAAYEIMQAISGLPNGVYKVEAQAAVTFHDNRVIKAYDGKGYPVIYANGISSNFNEMEADDQLSNQGKMSEQFTAGKYAVSPISFYVNDGTITVGTKSDRADIWAVWDNFQLTYYGKDATMIEQPIAHDRAIGLGYTPTEAEVDFTAAKAFLGVDEVTTSMLRIENPDGELISDYAPFDGWFNGDGVAETWGSNTKICVKFFEAIPNGKFTFYNMNNADEAGKTYTVKWRLVNGEKSVRYTISVNFFQPAAVEMEIVDKGIVASVSYDPAESSYVEKTVTLTDEQVATICAELGINALSEATVFGYNPTTQELVNNYDGFDGWRDANGDFHNWTGNAEAPACVKYTDGQTYLCYNIGGCDPQTIKTFWAIANDTKAVLVEIDFIYEGAPAGDVVFWENSDPEGNGAANWNGTYRFGLDGTDGNNECIATFTEDIWNKIKFGTFFMQYRPADPTSYMIRTTNGWWTVQWLGADNDIAPWNNAERINDNGDGTYFIEVTFGDDPIVETLDEKHLLFTGSGYTPLKLYFGDSNSIQGVKTVNVNNGVVYNLRGQKVDSSYKGVVIVNGKKMLQK